MRPLSLKEARAAPKAVDIGGVLVGGGGPLALIAGPCLAESPEVLRETASHLRLVSASLGLGLIFKASYDKANRTSVDSPRGPGLEKGLAMLADVKAEFGVPVISDVHSAYEAERAAGVLDCLQIPAFLCRQTDLLIAAGRTGRPVNIKKGQFMAPEDMENAALKAEKSGAAGVLLTERGTTFGYHDLVVDFRGLAVMARTGRPVVFDATHSVQSPGGLGSTSGGDAALAPALARAAAGAGIDALFVEVHPEPSKALCDGPNSLKLSEVEEILRPIAEIHRIARTAGR